MSVIFTEPASLSVGVVLETVKQIESHMLIRSYKGFMK